jgi:paraquat-inducible protein A
MAKRRIAGMWCYRIEASDEVWDRVRECPDCGLFQRLPALRPGAAATCFRCDAVLRRRRVNPLDNALAFSLAALFAYAVAISLPVLQVDIAGRVRWNTLFTGPEELGRQGFWPLAVVVLATTVLVPGLKLLLTLILLIGLRMQKPPSFLPSLLGWLEWLQPWAMLEVFLLGVLVAYTRLTAIAGVEVEEALYALGIVMLAMAAADAFLDRHDIWSLLVPSDFRSEDLVGSFGQRLGCETCRLVSRGRDGERCRRCGTRLRARKPDSIGRTWALLAAAAICYVPANICPVMTVIRFGRGTPNTILSGVQELLSLGMWPLALLVFFASFTVPLLKLVGLTWMLIATHRGSASRLRDRTRLYRIIDVVGRWSMIDVFMLSTLVALVRAGALASVIAGIGAVMFAAVVILTMLAVRVFDPRLMWDEAAARAAVADIEAEHVLG